MSKRATVAKGGRKTKKKVIPLDDDAKCVVQWLHRHLELNASDISRLTTLSYQFCNRWHKREGPEQVMTPGKRKGPDLIIPSPELPKLASKVRKVRLLHHLPKKWAFTARYAWPPNSPDLSPIETIWSILQDKVIEREAFTEEKLIEVIIEEWWALDQQIIRDLYDDMHRKCVDVLNNDGGRIPRMK